ncbi:MAG: glycosyltransferase [Muribaculaceae bacterium]|nr:glycosyltransferase [Muribaculaceae bacterium]
MPLFSIITVTYNAATTIEPTLKSVAEQTCIDYEHLIIDGKSVDTTLLTVEKYTRQQLTVISEKDNSIYDAMNKGLAMAKGQYVIFMNAGDTFHAPETLAMMAKAAEQCPGIIYGQTEIVRGADRIPVGARHLKAPKHLTMKSFKDGMLVCHQAMAVRRDITSPYDLRYRFSADFDWAIRCLKASDKNCYLDIVIADYLEEGTTTRNHRASLKERYNIMCRYYGTIPTIARHIKFAFRDLKRKIKH